LRLNIGFLISQTVGYSHDFPFQISRHLIPPDLELLELHGVARFTRTPQGLLAQIKLSANVHGECSRCLAEFLQPIESNFTELYGFTPKTAGETGLVVPEDAQLDISPLVREYLFLEMPINPLCKPDCKGICPTCGNNLNLAECNHEEPAGDPRLSALRSLLDKNQ
jgi:uncharacterized protein